MPDMTREQAEALLAAAKLLLHAPKTSQPGKWMELTAASDQLRDAIFAIETSR
jgi:hypothetical protein